MNFSVNPEISLEDGLSLYQAKMTQAMSALQSKGFVMPSAPMTTGPGGAVVPYRGEIPPDLTVLTDDHLGTYMGLLQQWGGYCEAQLSEADTNRTAAKATLELIEAKLRITYQKDGDKKRSNAERDDYVGSDRRFVEAKSEVLYWETMYSYIRAIASSAEGNYAAISRRVTQRGQEVDRLNRTGNVTGHGNLPGGPPPGPLFSYGHGRR